MKLSSILLLPVTCLYQAVTNIRNFLYNSGVFRSHNFEIPVICVGNLRVGGTGKTPFVDFLTSYFFNAGYKVGILSRGYGRKTRGFIKAANHSTSIDIGDEPLQYFLSYKGSVNVYVDEDRPHGVKTILQNEDETNLIILDDAYQHRPLKAKVNILLSEYKRPFYKDFLLPSGRLRESRSGVNRADIIVITKCPDTLTEKELKLVNTKIAIYSGGKIPVYFTKILYSVPVPLFNSYKFQDHKKFVLVCGIDNPEPFVLHCENNFSIAAKFLFKDHHSFNKEDIFNIKEKNLPVITTQKDISRLKLWEYEFQQLPIYYVPIKTGFLSGETDFLKSINDLINA